MSLDSQTNAKPSGSGNIFETSSIDGNPWQCIVYFSIVILTTRQFHPGERCSEAARGACPRSWAMPPSTRSAAWASKGCRFHEGFLLDAEAKKIANNDSWIVAYVARTTDRVTQFWQGPAFGRAINSKCRHGAASGPAWQVSNRAGGLSSGNAKSLQCRICKLNAVTRCHWRHVATVLHHDWIANVFVQMIGILGHTVLH